MDFDDDRDDTPNRRIPPVRSFLYYLGLGLSIGGVVLFIGAMASMMFGATRSAPSFHGPPREFILCFAGVVMSMLGGGLMKLGRGGAAGSGLLLDPEQARRDLEPWSRSGGGRLSDALDEVEPLKDIARGLKSAASRPATTVVKIRCRECRALADETARFCPQCGKPL